MTALYVPGTDEQDPKKLIMSQQLVAGQTSTNTTNIATNTAAIATLNAATYVNSIDSKSGAFTTNSASGISSSTANVISVTQGTTAQYGAFKVDGTTITSSSLAVLSVGTPSLSKVTNSTTADVALNNTANYFTGPIVAASTAGTWFVSGTITVQDTAGAADFQAKLWDGTTVIAAVAETSDAANRNVCLALSGYITAPSSSLRISCKDVTSTSGKIRFNATGNSVDSTITAIRIG